MQRDRYNKRKRDTKKEGLENTVRSQEIDLQDCIRGEMYKKGNGS